LSEPEPRLPWHSLPLTSLALSAGALRALTAAGYNTLGEVAAVPPADLAAVKGLDVRSYRRLRRILAQHRSAAARQLKDEGKSLRQAAQILGVSYQTVWRWVKETGAEKDQ
jgi:hypothetical protein